MDSLLRAGIRKTLRPLDYLWTSSKTRTRDPVLDMLADFNLIVTRLRDGARVVYVHPTAADLRWEAA